MGTRSQKAIKLRCLWKHVPVCAGMARKGNSRIVTMFAEANWVTASRGNDGSTLYHGICPRSSPVNRFFGIMVCTPRDIDDLGHPEAYRDAAQA